MAAAKDQRSRPVERVEQGERLRAGRGGQGRRDQQKGREQRERDDAARRVTGKFRCPETGAAVSRQSQRPAQAPSAIAAICANDPANRTTITIAASAMPARARSGCEGSRHAPDGLCDDRNSDELEAVQETFGNRTGECGCAGRKGEHDQGRWHREGEPRRQSAKKSVTAQDSEWKTRPGWRQVLGGTGRVRRGRHRRPRRSICDAQRIRRGNSRDGRSDRQMRSRRA